jgi:hypothetical protein
MFSPKTMSRSLLLLALAASFVGCKTLPSSGDAGRYSWQKDAPAAVDNTRAIVRALRPEYALIELSLTLEKRDPGTRLQLTKAGKNFVVEVIKADEKSAVVAIVAGQASVPEVRVGDDLALAVVAQ